MELHAAVYCAQKSAIIDLHGQLGTIKRYYNAVILRSQKYEKSEKNSNVIRA